MCNSTEQIPFGFLTWGVKGTDFQGFLRPGFSVTVVIKGQVFETTDWKETVFQRVLQPFGIAPNPLQKISLFLTVSLLVHLLQICVRIEKLYSKFYGSVILVLGSEKFPPPF
jgi:hypothetical protein